MKQWLIAGIFLLNSLIVLCQRGLRPLHIGDKMPAIVLKGFMDSNRRTDMKNLKGKLVILDIWNTGCLVCVAGMPKLELLQKQFRDSIEIILVTNNSAAEVKRLFGRMKKNFPAIPMMVGDTVLNQLFPHVTVPHQVWINGDGHVQFITDAYNATVGNIRRVLHKMPVDIHFKNEISGFSTAKLLLEEGDGRLFYHLKYYSFLMNRIDEYAGSYLKLFDKDSAAHIIRTRIVNYPVLGYFKLAFGNLISDGLADEYSGELFDNRLLIETRDSSRLHFPSNEGAWDEWNAANLYSYESAIPLCETRQAYQYFQSDINKFFPYYGTIEKRMVKCLVLKRTSNVDKIKTTGGKPLIQSDEKGLRVKNTPMKSVVRRLAWLLSDKTHPLLDETGYEAAVDLSIATDPRSLELIRKALITLDLELIGDYREIDMLVIRDKTSISAN